MNEPSPPSQGPFSRDRFALARLLVGESQPLHDVIKHATRISANALGVARVGVWVFSDDRQTLSCLHTHFEGSGPTPNDICELHAHDFPHYLAALERHRWICADDALTNEATSELAAPYLVPLGITSMLDAPIFRGDHLFGVVCHEHVGPKRTWSERDKGFAGSAADILALVLEQSMHLEAERRLRALEVGRRAAQKLETLGRFALGISHDFNNVLSAIRLAAATVARGPDVESAKAIAQELEAAATVGGTLTNALLRFARSQSADRRTIDLSETVASLEPLLRLLTRESADLRLVLADSGSAWVEAAPSDVQQILLNLVSNAEQSLAGRGRISVTVTRESNEAVLVVEDTGRGIAEEARGRLFDPLFTTRESGTGWGLATVQSIVNELGARVEVQSRQGEGSRFSVRFPLAVEGRRAIPVARDSSRSTG